MQKAKKMESMRGRRSLWSAGCLLLAACGSSSSSTNETPAPSSSGGEVKPTAMVESSPSQQALGQLPEEMVKMASGFKGVSSIALTLGAQGQVEKVAVEHKDEAQVPEKARKIAGEQFANAKVENFESEVYLDVGKVYEIETLSAKKQECEVAVKEDGSVLYKECKVATKDLPKAVREGALRSLPKGQVREAEKRESSEGEEYRVEVEAEERSHYLHLKPSGELIRHLIRVPAKVYIPAP